MQTASLIFPNQLFHNIGELLEADRYYFIEESLYFNQYGFHKIKLVFHRSSMKQKFDQMVAEGMECQYIEAHENHADVRKLLTSLSKNNYERLIIFDPEDDWLYKRISRVCLELNIDLIVKANPLFINTKEELLPFFKPTKKKFFQTSFYKEQRVNRQVLVNELNEPIGGKWTFDSENRKKYPRKKTPPTIDLPEANRYWQGAVEYVQSYFSENPGKVDTIVYPTNHAEAEAWLTAFLEVRFEEFGPYEDAIVAKEIFLNHSVLSPLINVGLIKPMDVIERAIHFANKSDIPINSLEGFVRQILGWREFIRGMYKAKGTESRNHNFWGFQRNMPDCFYNGTTGMPPVDDAINKVLDTGYCHHIERLMVLGNFMLLCEINPDEVYRWFMELFIDAYDWVMVPNIYGMSQFADGGLFATKPYISGSNYIIKMSDHKKGDWQKTWDGLFWRFMDINRNFFLNNPRLSMLVRMFDKMSEEKKSNHITNAEAYLRKLDQEKK